MPTATPVARPEAEPIVNTAILLLDHVPPGVTSASVVDPPIQTNEPPAIDAGGLLTVTAAVVLQVVGKVYVINSVPAAMPVTTPPDELMDAMPVPPLLQVPPVGVLPSVVVRKMQIGTLPVNADGNGFTVIGLVVVQPA